jgi:hypothetical protein
MEGSLHVETVDPGTLDLVKKVMADANFDEFKVFVPDKFRAGSNKKL